MKILKKIGSAVSAWYKLNTMNSYERYLSEAKDHVDLECRMRNWHQKNKSESLMFAGRC